MSQDKNDPIDSTSPVPLGPAALEGPQPIPGTRPKNAPADYFIGGVTDQVSYWRNRAITAENRLRARLKELELMQAAREKLVVIESPFAGDREKNVAYARALVRHALKQGLYPYASHLFYPQVLDDDHPQERKLGIDAGFAWGALATKTFVGIDLGISKGMELGIAAAKERGREVVEVRLEGWGRK